MSFLRSANYFRQYINLNRALINSVSSSNIPRNILQKQISPIVCLSSRNVAHQPEEYHSNITVEYLLDKLDQSVRRTSRVNKPDVDLLFRLIERHRPLTPSQSALIIRCCGRLLVEVLPENRQKMVEHLLNTLKSSGVKFDILHYNTLLKVYCENGNKLTPAEFLAQLEKDGIMPDRITYQRLITHCCKNGDIQGATNILEYMKEKQLPINEQVFNSLILGHSQCNDLESAEGIITLMTSSGLRPTSETYTTLMSGYAKTGNIDKVKELITKCESSNIILEDEDYLKIVQELVLNGHESLIGEVLNKIPKSSDYNQEAINVILPLIAGGHEDAAYTISKTMEKFGPRDESATDNNYGGGNFFIRQMVRAHRPIEKVKHYLEVLSAEHGNPFIYQIAMKSALQGEDVDYAKQVMKFAAEKGHPIRPHYFWPLMKTKALSKDVEGLYQILEIMIQDFDIMAFRETTREVLIGELLKCGEAPESIMDRITGLGVPSGTVASALVYNLLKVDRIKDAVKIVKTHRAFYQPYFIRPMAVKAFFATRDMDSFLTIIRAMYLSAQRQENYRDSLNPEDISEEVFNAPDKVGVICRTVYDIMNNFSKDKNSISVFEDFLKLLLDYGLPITDTCAYKVQSSLKQYLTPELADVLEKLSSDNLEAVPLPSVSPVRSSQEASLQDERALRQILDQRKKEGRPIDFVQNQLFQLYCRSKEVDKVVQMKQEIEDSGNTLPEGLVALLADMYISLEDLDKTLEVLESHRKENPSFCLDYTKTLKLAELLIKKDKIKEAEELLEAYPVQERKNDESPYLQNTLCRKLLNAIAEKGDTEMVEKFYDLLTSKHYVEPSSSLLGPVIKSYLVRDDLSGALDKFESYCRTFNFTPLKNELTKKLIEVEDAASLQRITDLSTTIHGEVNSLQDLMACFLEMGRVRQARKILETPGLRARQDRLNRFSANCLATENEEYMKRLLEVTKGIPNLDRSIFYLDNLKLYAATNNVEKAYSLLMEMQEEDELPSNDFLVMLADLLKKNNREVPFQVPDVQKDSSKFERMVDGTPLNRFRQYLNAGDVKNALAFVNHPAVPVSEKSILVSALLNIGDVEKARKVVRTILEDGHYVDLKVFKRFMRELGRNGNYKAIEELEPILHEKLRKEAPVTSSLVIAYQNAGKTNEIFKKLEEKMNNADRDSVQEYFPLRTLVRLVIDHPEYVPDMEKLCEKLNPISPIASQMALWSVYFAHNSKPEETERLWKSLSETDALFIDPILRHAETLKNMGLVERVKERVWQDSNVPNHNVFKGRVVSAELRILTRTFQVEEALNKLETALKTVDISYLKRMVLIDLKKLAERVNVPFNYVIPERRKSSVDDDDEDLHKVSTQ